MFELVALRSPQGHRLSPTHRRKESPLSLRRWQDGLDGQGLVEYSLVLILVAVAVASSLAVFGPFLTGLFDRVVASFPA